MIPPEAEAVLFKWVFEKVRGRTADENPNVFYRHENIALWDQIRRYDDKHSTSFASRFDIANPDDAPTMHEVEAEYLSHRARRKPHAILDDLLRRLADLTAEMLANEGAILRAPSRLGVSTRTCSSQPGTSERLVTSQRSGVLPTTTRPNAISGQPACRHCRRSYGRP